MEGFAFLRRTEKFVASFRIAIHAFVSFQPLRWLKWWLVPGGKEGEQNIWRHDRPERGMWVHQLTCNRRDDHADKGVQCDLGDNASGRQPRLSFADRKGNRDGKGNGKGSSMWDRWEEGEQEHARDVDEWRNWQCNTSKWGPSESGVRWTPRVLYTGRQNARLNFTGVRVAHVELFFRENLREMGARLRISDGQIAKNRTDSRIYRVKQLMMHIAILLFDDAAMTDSPDVENGRSQDDADSIVETDDSLDSIS